jgi:hypothetical protein
MLPHHWESIRVSSVWLGGSLHHAAWLSEQLHRLVPLFVLLLQLLVVVARVVMPSQPCWMMRLMSRCSGMLMPPHRFAETAAAVLWQCEPPVSWCCLCR